MQALLTRKVMAGLLILLVGVGITLIKGDIPPNLLSLLQVIYGTFVLGNVGQHAADSFSGKNKDA